MGSFSSKPTPAAPKPISTTTSVPSTVPTTVPTTIHITPTGFRTAEVRCWINNHEILYISLAFIFGILLTVLVFAVISLFRKIHKRSHQNLQDLSQMAAEESFRNTQNEVTYTTVVFQRGQTARPV